MLAVECPAQLREVTRDNSSCMRDFGNCTENLFEWRALKTEDVAPECAEAMQAAWGLRKLMLRELAELREVDPGPILDGPNKNKKGKEP